MTTQGCKECPPEEVILPLRNMAAGIAMIGFSILWIWFSWSPFFPGLAERLTGGSKMFSACSDWGGKLAKIGKHTVSVFKAFHTLREKAAEAKLPQYFKIFVGFFQITSSFLSFQVKWPITFLNALMWLKATINFSVLSLPGVSCLWKTITYRRRLLVYTLSPVFLVAILALPVCFALYRVKQAREDTEEGKRKRKSREKRCSATLDRFWNGVMFTAFMLYPLLALITLEPFNCQPAGLGLLAADYREPCPDPMSLERIWAAVFIIVYPIGIPVGSILILRSMGVQRLAKEKVDAALTSAMINLYIKRTTSVESQRITQLIGPLGENQEEFKRRVRALYCAIWPEGGEALDHGELMELKIGSRRVKVKILHGKGLPRTDQIGHIDSYCWVSLAGRKERTRAQKNTANPSWANEDFIFEVEEGAQITDEMLTLTIQVMDWDQMGRNTLVGQVGIKSTEIKEILKSKPGSSKEFKLQVDIVPGTDIFDASTNCYARFCPGKNSASNLDSNTEKEGTQFELLVYVESLENVIAGAEVSMIQNFAILYDANGVKAIIPCCFPIFYVPLRILI
jgi:hypothetical protein